MGFVIHYDVAAIVIVVTILFHYYCKKTIVSKSSEIFAMMLWIHLGATLLDMGTALMINRPGALPLSVLYVSNSIYCLFCYGTTSVYLRYLVYTTKRFKTALSVLDYIKVWLPFIVDAVLILTTAKTRFVFYFEADGTYHHGPGYYVLYATMILYFVMALGQTFFYRTRLKKEQRITFYVYTLINIAAVVFEMITYRYLITQFVLSMSMLLIYFSVESPEDYRDKKLGVFNRDGFILDIQNALNMGKPFRLAGIHIGGLSYLNETIGEENKDLLLNELVEFLCHIGGKNNVVTLSNSEFVIRFDDNDFAQDCLIEMLQKRFTKPFSVCNVEVSLTAALAILHYPKDADTLDNIMDLLEYAMNEAAVDKEHRVIYANEDVLEKKRRENQVLHLMQETLREKKFEVYYQPIFSVEKKRYTSAEALIRMPVTELGFVSPEEFIPIAEKNGMILEIGEFVFRSVCDFMVREQIWEKGIEHIHVNLSVVQCMQERLAQNFLEIMEDYALPCSRINLEVTETAAVVSSECLSSNMNKLVEHGVSFALDDYGTGFSNATSLIQYPYNTIKIDKGVVWAAMENENAMKVLSYSIAMIKSLKMDIVAEGVETLEQAKELGNMGCDYFQGYYYSKPMKEIDFVALLEHNCA